MNQKKLFFLITLIICITTVSGCISPRDSTTKIPPYETTGISQHNPSPSQFTVTANSSVPAEVQQRAEEAIHRFIQSDKISLTYEKTDNFGQGDLFTFTSETGIYIVNNNTGRVQFAQLNYSHSPESYVISEQDAYLIAESYAKEKYPQLWMNSPIRSVNVSHHEMLNHGTMGTDYLFIWRDIWYNPRSDIPDPVVITGFNNAQVTVDDHGRVTGYSEVYSADNPPVNLTPALTEEEAWDIANSFYEKQGIRGILPAEKTNQGLWIYDDAANDIGWPKYGEKNLAWVFSVKHQGEWLMGGQVFVDAQDGHIINYGEIL